MNTELSHNTVIEFCEVYYLENLVKEYACFKIPSNMSGIDLILVNSSKCFQNTVAGLSDFQKMTV